MPRYGILLAKRKGRGWATRDIGDEGWWCGGNGLMRDVMGDVWITQVWDHMLLRTMNDTMLRH